MQLHVDHGSIESAIAELKRVDPRRHKPRSALRRELRQWRTRELGAAE
jgi:hypothetical protein